MITSLSGNEKNINAALNSLDVLKKMQNIISQTKTSNSLSLKMAVDVRKYRELIENEIPILKTAINTVEDALHTRGDTSQDDKIAELREILNSFDPDGQITDTDATLF